jgi:lysophospholipase L1-like esterase
VSSENWVFLGDSLTEGIGSRRDNYVTELANLLRQEASGRAVHDVRLRRVDAATFNRDIPTNLSGFLTTDQKPATDALWLWNLASEATCIDNDVDWVPLVSNLEPRHIFIHRGGLESIIRPAAIFDGAWPPWVPRAWRGLVAMDPRCYFSRGGVRRFKQVAIDTMKQRARLRLLSARSGRPLYDAGVIQAHYERLLDHLVSHGVCVHILGLIPPDDRRFPGSAAHFSMLNARLRQLALSHGVDFIDWAVDVERAADAATWRCRDGFHPSPDGARMLARILRDRLTAKAGVR